MREKTINKVDLEKSIKLLKHCLDNQASPEANKWLDNKIEQINKSNSDAQFFMTFSALPTYFSKDMLSLTDKEIKEAEQIHKYWFIKRWSVAHAARIYLILNYIKKHPENFKPAIDKIFNAADINELIALYQALPLFPDPEQFLLHGTNGIRSNMLSVFEAIALNNSYPNDNFNETAWNQLVLKTLHVDSPIEQVIGLKNRANPALAQALMNTALERFAAERPIKPELWCLIGLSLDEKTFPALKRFFQSHAAILQNGALLALNYSNLSEAKELLKQYNDKQKDIETDLNKLRNFEKRLI